MLFKEIFMKYLNQNKIKKNLLLITGLPGSGKGTFAEILKNDFNFYHISFGNIFRKLSTDGLYSKQIRFKKTLS